MIISLGYRVKSIIAANFRRWATECLNWKELSDRVRDIHSSEKVMYRQVLDLYATSVEKIYGGNSMANELLENLERLHTTELGVMRIKKNLSLNEKNVIEWCKEKISLPNAEIIRKGKNWYITIDNCIITINAYSYTVITAHKVK